ncbi:hypothetical protein SDJN02_06816, partial [Cucurbita argyrosperma subsp. argyrosperma]
MGWPTIIQSTKIPNQILDQTTRDPKRVRLRAISSVLHVGIEERQRAWTSRSKTSYKLGKKPGIHWQMHRWCLWLILQSSQGVEGEAEAVVEANGDVFGQVLEAHSSKMLKIGERLAVKGQEFDLLLLSLLFAFLEFLLSDSIISEHGKLTDREEADSPACNVFLPTPFNL